MVNSKIKKIFSVISACALTFCISIGGLPTVAFADSFTITYVAGTGGTVGSPFEVVDGTLPAGTTASAAAGFTFKNWTDSNGNVYTEDTIVPPIPTADITYTANFEADTPAPPAPQIDASRDVYIAAYNVVDIYGNQLMYVNPGDNVVVAVTVIDDRIPESIFNAGRNNLTNRIHVTMAQGAFTIPNNGCIDVRTRESVNGSLCYTIAFRDVTYLGGKPDFSFTVSYTDGTGPMGNNNIPLGVPQAQLGLSITQAVDNIPAPNIILNSANYGKTVSAGSNFTLSTSAVNTSTALDLDNVSLKIILPQGLSMANGNSQVLIGKVGKGGTINHSFALTAGAVTTEMATLPVTLVYSFEAFVNGQRQTYTSEQQISVNVQQATRFDIQDIDFQDEMYVNNSGYLSVTLTNKGKSTVYNVQAEIVSDDFTGADVEFIGNIASGSSNETDFNFTSSKTGINKGTVRITYEDAAGNTSVIEREFSMEVIEEPKWDFPDDPQYFPDEPVKEKSIVPFIAGGIAVVAAIVGAVVLKKKKAKRKAELEDEDEDF